MNQFIIIALLGLNTFFCSSQVKDFKIYDFADSIILIPSMTEESGVRYLDHILSDTNNVIIHPYQTFYTTKGIELGNLEISSNEEPQCRICNDLIIKLSKTNRFYEFPGFNDKHCLDTFSLRKANPKEYLRLMEKYHSTFARFEILSMPDSLKISLVSDLTRIYDLRVLDSVLLMHTFFESKPTRNELRDILKGKKIYQFQELLFFDLSYLYKFQNSTVIVGKKGEGLFRFSRMRLKNRLKKYSEFSVIPYEDIPSKVKLTRDLIVPNDFFKNNKAIFASRLKECME